MKLLSWLASAAIAVACMGGVQAQEFPNRPIKLIVPSAPGGGLDVVARLLADHVTKKQGAQVIVEYKPGAGGNIATAFVAKSEPDGYTLLLGSTGNAVNGSLYPNLPFSPEKDLAPVVLVGKIPMVLLAGPGVPVNNVQELLARARAHPNELNFGSGGMGTLEHLSFELFKRKTGISAQHVAYRGGGNLYTDLLAGHIQLFFNNQLAATPYVQSGQLRAVGITSATRSAQLPEVKTFAEQGVQDFNLQGWWGVIGPAGLSKPVLAKANSLFGQAIRSPEVQERLKSLGAQPDGGSAEDFETYFRSQIRMYADIIKTAGIRIE